MAEPINFNLRSVYSFSLYPIAALGAGYTNATIMAIMDTATANREIDTQALHALVYPTLPNGSAPNDPNGYDYVKIKTSAGRTTILGLPWIDPSSVVLVDSTTIVATISNVSAGDLATIKNALAANGFNSVTFTVGS
jgi:hypothetical protein